MEIAAAVVMRGRRRPVCRLAAGDLDGLGKRGGNVLDIAASCERDVAAAERAKALEEGTIVDPARILRPTGRGIEWCDGAAGRLAIDIIPGTPELPRGHTEGRAVRREPLAGGIDRCLDADDVVPCRHCDGAAARRPDRRGQQPAADRRRRQRRRGEAGGIVGDMARRINRAGRDDVEQGEIAGCRDRDRAGAGTHQRRDIDQELVQRIDIRRMAVNGDIAGEARRQRRELHDGIGIDRGRAIAVELRTADDIVGETAFAAHRRRHQIGG